jgi:hypothetical protein
VDYALTPFTVNNTDAIYGLTTGTGVQSVFGVKMAGTNISNYIASIGNPTFDLDGKTKNVLLLSGDGGNIHLDQSTNASFAAEVDYTYTPATTSTPEPATMGLLGSALAGLVMFRKRFAR